MTPQSTFMIIATVPDKQLKKLRSLLATMSTIPGHANPDNNLVPFNQFDRLHFARFMILEATTDDIKVFGITPRPWQPQLAFFGDIDGDRDSFLTELVEVAGTGLKKIFSLCEGFSKQDSHLLDWMKEHNVQPVVNYVNWIGRTVKQIHEESAIHESLSTYIQENVSETGRENTRALRQKLLSHIEFEKHEGRLTLSEPEATPIEWKIREILHLVGIPVILLLLTPLFLLIAPFFAIRLRMLERSDPEIFIRPDPTATKRLSLEEDQFVSNPFSVFGDLKPGLFRLYTFKAVLFLLDYLTRHVYNKGFLMRIKTIHFARWVLLDNNRKVLFPTNYDGSHESYMDDFINKVGWGLNIIFSNFAPYPSTKWMIKGGAQREQHFKFAQRRHQLPSEIWYKAYPDLTATDLGRNSRIRQGVEIRQSSDAEIREWLSLI